VTKPALLLAVPLGTGIFPQPIMVISEFLQHSGYCHVTARQGLPPA